MFELHCDSDVYRLLVGEAYIIGRSKDCRIQLPTAPSVSRQHADIAVTADHVAVTDRASRFGTFVNDKRIDSGATQRLCDGDVIRFGNASAFTLKVRKVIAATSRLDKAASRAVSAACKRIGIQLADKANADIDVLFVTDGTLTAKFVFAVACGGIIVTANWSADAERTAVTQPKSPAPDFAKYQPQTPFAQQIFPPRARRALFSGIAFVFIDGAAYERTRDMIGAVGGTAIHCAHTAEWNAKIESAGVTRWTAVTAGDDDLRVTAPSTARIAEADIGTFIVTARVPPTNVTVSAPTKRRHIDEFANDDVKRSRHDHTTEEATNAAAAAAPTIPKLKRQLVSEETTLNEKVEATKK